MSTAYRPKLFRNVLIGALLLLTILVTFLYFSEGAQGWLLRWSEVLSGAGSILLSGLLVVLYRQQMGLLAIEQRPLIDIEYDEADERSMILYLSNAGKGVATDLELVTVTVFPEIEHFQPGISVTKCTRKTEDLEYTRGRSVKPSEQRAAFEARPGLGLKYQEDSEEVDLSVSYPDQQTSNYGFSSGLDELKRQETPIIRIYFYVRYTNSLGEKQLKYVHGLELDGDAGKLNYEEACENGARVFFGEPTVTSTDLSFDLSTDRSVI
jgi:hypothetical protein